MVVPTHPRNTLLKIPKNKGIPFIFGKQGIAGLSVVCSRGVLQVFWTCLD